jgi:hypothetical protein
VHGSNEDENISHKFAVIQKFVGRKRSKAKWMNKLQRTASFSRFVRRGLLDHISFSRCWR